LVYQALLKTTVIIPTFNLEGLNSSLAQTAAKLWLAKVCPERANYALGETF